MKCQFGLAECSNEAEYENKNGVCVCLAHKRLLDAFNWETRKTRKWAKIKDKPLLLSDELIEIWERFDPEKPVPLLDMVQTIAQAQREADIKFYSEHNQVEG